MEKKNKKKTTQSEKLFKAHLLACRMKSVAKSLRDDARCFDVSFPIGHAETLDRLADEYLKME